MTACFLAFSAFRRWVLADVPAYTAPVYSQPLPIPSVCACLPPSRMVLASEAAWFHVPSLSAGFTPSPPLQAWKTHCQTLSLHSPPKGSHYRLSLMLPDYWLFHPRYIPRYILSRWDLELQTSLHTLTLPRVESVGHVLRHVLLLCLTCEYFFGVPLLVFVMVAPPPTVVAPVFDFNFVLLVIVFYYSVPSMWTFLLNFVTPKYIFFRPPIWPLSKLVVTRCVAPYQLLSKVEGLTLLERACNGQDCGPASRCWGLHKICVWIQHFYMNKTLPSGNWMLAMADIQIQKALSNFLTLSSVHRTQKTPLLPLFILESTPTPSQWSILCGAHYPCWSQWWCWHNKHQDPFKATWKTACLS